MSFRFTNDLITTFKQKALMAHYTSAFLYSRTFVGYCAGITAKVNSSCQVLELKIDDAARSNFMEGTGSAANAPSAAEVAPADAIASAALSGKTASEVPSQSATVDSKKLAKAIEMAIWEATRKVKAAKEEYYHLSVKNSRLLAAGRELTGEAPEATATELATIRDFSKYGLSTDSALIAPHPWDSFRDRGPFHTMLNSPNYNLNGAGSSSSHLAKDFGLTKPLTLADIIPEYRAAFLSYPAGAVNATIKDTSAGKREGDERTLTTAPAEVRKLSAESAALADRNLAQKELREIRAAAAKEEASDELAFWTRVEAIRKGQQAVIGASLNKRPYKDQAGAVPVSNFDEKIQLRFIS